MVFLKNSETVHIRALGLGFPGPIQAWGSHPLDMDRCIWCPRADPCPRGRKRKPWRGHSMAKTSISRFWWYSGPDGACKWVIWGWESGSGSCALHSRPHLMLRVLNLDMSVVVRTTFCSVVFGCLSNQCARCSLTNRKYTRDAHRACAFRKNRF